MESLPGEEFETAAERELAAILQPNAMNSVDEIEKTLNDKAKKNQLTKINVKNLIKNIIMNEDVATMLRQTLDEDGDANCLYEPKLTRARIREMLKSYPASVHQWSSNQHQSIISECKLWIEQEFSDDSEDEEYQPDKTIEEEDEEYDDDESKCTENNKSFETENDTDNNTSVPVTSFSEKETIGMRTRSKFSLNDTPLEIIEQAFIPPDITEDMYDSACENDEWMEFLSEFTKPLESVQNDDNEDDPEYNVLCDDDFTTVDKEEFRIDKSVKVTRKEYNDLMNELYEFTESYLESHETIETDKDNSKSVNSNKDTVKSKNSSQLVPAYTSNYNDCHSNTIGSTSDVQTTNVVNCCTHLEKQINLSQPFNYPPNIDAQLAKRNYVFPATMYRLILTSNDKQQNRNSTSNKTNMVKKSVSKQENINCQSFGMLPKQFVLLKHQLTQHVQLATQNFILCTMAKQFRKNCHIYKKMLQDVKALKINKKMKPVNIQPSLRFIQDWVAVHRDLTEIRSYVLLPLEVREFMLFYNKPVFIFPQMLPSRTYSFETKTVPLLKPEEKFLLMKIDYAYNQLKERSCTRAKYRNQTLSDMMPVILETVTRRWFRHRRVSDLKRYLCKRKNDCEENITKCYLTNGKIEETVHIVDVTAMTETKLLYEYNINHFPPYWRSTIIQLMAKS